MTILEGFYVRVNGKMYENLATLIMTLLHANLCNTGVKGSYLPAARLQIFPKQEDNGDKSGLKPPTVHALS